VLHDRRKPSQLVIAPDGFSEGQDGFGDNAKGAAGDGPSGRPSGGGVTLQDVLKGRSLSLLGPDNVLRRVLAQVRGTYIGLFCWVPGKADREVSWGPNQATEVFCKCCRS
jgi:hypothetical protein